MSDKVNNIKYLTIGLVFLTLARAITLLIRMGSRIIIARYSTIDIYGLFSVIWNEMTFISTLALLGLGQKLTIDLPRKNKEQKKTSILSALSYASLVALVTAIITIILYVLNLDNNYKYSTLLSIFFIVFLFVQFIFTGLKDFLGFFVQSASQSLSMFLLILIFRKMLAINIIVYATCGSIAFSVLISIIYIIIRKRSELKEISFHKIRIFNFSKKRLNLFFVDIVNCVILYLLLKLPQIIVGDSLAGFINIAFSIIAFLVIPSQMISVALGPKISKDFSDEKPSELHNSFRITSSLLFVIQGIIIISFSYFGNFFIELLYGFQYVSGTSLIFYGFLLVVVLDSFNYPYAYYIRNTNQETLFAIGKAISLVAFVVSEIILLYLLGDFVSLAVPISYLISTLSLVAFYFFFTIKLNPKIDKTDIRKILTWFIFIFSSIILAMISGYYLSNVIYILITTVSHIILFIIYLILSKTINIKGLIKDVKELKASINKKKLINN